MGFVTGSRGAGKLTFVIEQAFPLPMCCMRMCMRFGLCEPADANPKTAMRRSSWPDRQNKAGIHPLSAR